MIKLTFTLMFMGASLFASAQNFTVNSTLDATDNNPGDGTCDDGTGNCTLRAAIMESNALGGAHDINIPAGTYGLTIAGAQEDAAQTGDLDITSNISFIGASPQTTFINADSLDRVFHVLAGATVSMTMIDIQEGYVSPGNGGGILNEGDLTITYCIIEDNHAKLVNGNPFSLGYGGGISNEGTLNMTNSTIASNTSKGGRGVNGLNGGGGGGSTPGFGGGIFNGATGTATLENITVSGNSAFGGKHSSGSVNAGNWNFDGQNGAGLLFGIGGASGGGTGGNGGDQSGGGGGGSEPFGGGLGGNGGFGAGGGGGGASAGGGTGGSGGTGGEGGGVGGQPCCSYGGGGGAGAGMGGGIFNNGGTMTLNSSTIAFNESFGGSGASGWGGWAWGGSSGTAFGAGIYNRTGTVEINNTIVSNNQLHNSVLDNDPIGTITDGDIHGTFTSTNGHNLVFNGGPGILGGNTTGNVIGADPLLGALAFNGGETSTHEILPCPASPAINAADGATAATLDQRDFARNGVPDIGAFEGESADIDLAAVVVSPCVGDTTGEIAITASSGTAPYDYQWDAAANNQITATAVNLGAGTYTVSISDDNNCVKDTTITITALATPVVDLGPDTTLCDGNNIVLDAQNPGDDYVWQDASSNQTYSATTAGVYSVEVTNTTTGCTHSDTMELFIEQVPTAGADNLVTTCNSGGQVDLNTMLDPGISGGAWSETTPNPSQMMDVATGMFGMDQTLSGTYTFQYTVPGTFCPADSSEMTVEVSIQPTAGNNNNTVTCSTDGTIDVNAMLSAGVSPGTWSETTPVPSGQFNATTGVFDPDQMASGMYTFEYATDSVAPCPISTSIMTVEVILTPTVSFVLNPIEGCDPLEVQFNNTSNADAGSTCHWDLGDGNISTDCSLSSHTYVGPGCYDVSLTVDNQGCVSSATITDAVCVHPVPNADFTWASSQVFSDDPTVPFQNQSTDAVIFNWSFGDGNGSSEENPVHTYEQGVSGDYDVQLVVTSEHGCMDSVTKTVTISEILLFYIPNSFTPDGDEYNDNFGPVMTQGFDPFDYHFQIFNRWGELIFESHDASIGWDGTYGGREVQDGTFTWKLSFGDLYTDERRAYVGSVTMVR